MRWAVLIPEFIALVSFVLKRMFPEEKLVKSIIAETIKRFAPQEIDSSIATGLEMQLTDSFEVDVLRRDVQSASLAAFSGGVVLWISRPPNLLILVTVVVWLALLLFTSRIGSIVESSRSVRKLRYLYCGSFLGLVGLSAVVKIARIIA